MIPKRIFYVWGANEPLRESVKKYIDSWKKFLPDYEIIQIDEESKKYFDFQKELDINKWFNTVYAKKMWAYVSDYVRVKTLFDNGGIYLDTDVEVLKSFDDLLSEPAFVGIQNIYYTEPAILGAQKNNPFLRNVLEFYKEDIWNSKLYKIPQIFEKFLSKEKGYAGYKVKEKQEIINLKDISVFPQKYFIPFNGMQSYKEEYITPETYTIHWFGGSWVKPEFLFFLDNKHKKSVEELNEFYEKNKIDIIRRYKVLDLWGKKIIKGETDGRKAVTI